MGEIRFVGTGETGGYPYLVCKKTLFLEKGRKCLLEQEQLSGLIW